MRKNLPRVLSMSVGDLFSIGKGAKNPGKVWSLTKPGGKQKTKPQVKDQTYSGFFAPFHLHLRSSVICDFVSVGSLDFGFREVLVPQSIGTFSNCKC